MTSLGELFEGDDDDDDDDADACVMHTKSFSLSAEICSAFVLHVTTSFVVDYRRPRVESF